MDVRTREEMDAEVQDPWTVHISPLFNDITLKPNRVVTLSVYVTRSVVDSVNPCARPYERDALTLKRKFGEFKSLYGIKLGRYNAYGQGDPENFVNFTN